MGKTIFMFHKDGKERPMKEKMALHLQKAGKGSIKTNTYLTRDMVPHQPPIAPQQQALVPAPTQPNITDAARQLADENGLDTTALQGTGANGAITVADVKKALQVAE